MREVCWNLTLVAAASVHLIALGCSNDTRSADGRPAAAPAAPSAEPLASTGALTDSIPLLLEDSYGLETGDVGVEECDRWLALVAECDKSLDHDETLRLKALEELRPSLTERGCAGSKR
jgi:hypothetical protein